MTRTAAARQRPPPSHPAIAGPGFPGPAAYGDYPVTENELVVKFLPPDDEVIS